MKVIFEEISSTIPFKINHPVHNISMYWPSFWRPTFGEQQSIFEKTLIHRSLQLKPSSSVWHRLHPTWSILYRGAVNLWIFARIRNWRHFPSKCSNILQRLTVPRIIEPILTQKVPNEAWRCGLQTSMSFLFTNCWQS